MWPKAPPKPRWDVCRVFRHPTTQGRPRERCRRSQTQSGPAGPTANLQVAPASNPRRPSQPCQPQANKETGWRGRLSHPPQDRHHCQQELLLGTTGAQARRPSKRLLKQQEVLQGGCGSGEKICGRGQRCLDTHQGLIIPSWVTWTGIVIHIVSWGGKNSSNVLANISKKTPKTKQWSKISMCSALRAQKGLKLRSTNAWRMLNICTTNCRGGRTSSWSLILK